MESITMFTTVLFLSVLAITFVVLFSIRNNRKQVAARAARRAIRNSLIMVHQSAQTGSPPPVRIPQPPTPPPANKHRWLKHTILFFLFSLVPAGWLFYGLFLGPTSPAASTGATKTDLTVGIVVSWVVIALLGAILLFWLLPRLLSVIPKLWGFTSNTSGKAKVVVLIILVLASLHFLFFVFFDEEWRAWRGHAILFWGTNLAIVVVAFLALAGFHYGKTLAWVFGVLATAGILSHFSKTPAWEKLKKSATSISSPAALAKVELPRGVLVVKAGDVKGLAEKMKWPKEHVVHARNVVIDGPNFNFDLWDDTCGKYGEFRWNRKYTPARGTSSNWRSFPIEAGTWYLARTGTTDEYEGRCYWIDLGTGKELEVPVKFFVER